jgi:molybdopterin synthase catalytic subunit
MDAMIKVQREDFDVGAELEQLTAGQHDIGGVASFVGLVREFVGAAGEGPPAGSPGAVGKAISAMTLEHYPGMTEKKLAEIEAEAGRRWPLAASLIIHRYGRLEPGERIVLVATASAHRQGALEACAFLIDWLKTQAPFWKLEETPDGAEWVEARESDGAAAERWRPRRDVAE